MKTSELTGAALDWAVAKCEDFRDGFAIIRVWNNRVTKITPGDYETSEVYTIYSPSTNWAQGGPIIERENIGIGYGVGIDGDRWEAGYTTPEETGHTPLIAAMRCYVASKLGDEVDVPEELCQLSA